MKFYRPLQRIEAMTFDLDDTLYDNAPVIRRTETETVQFLRHYHPALSSVDAAEFKQRREELLALDANIYHDVTKWRYLAVHLIMTLRGLNEAEATLGAKAVMDVFAHWRSQINVPQNTLDTLKKLAKRWPLVAITNGNADPDVCGLSPYFQFTLRAGPDGRAKPWEDMYQVAAQRLNLPLGQILHVGDDLTTDVAGSLRCGMQACWINMRGSNLLHINDARLLPHLEVSQVNLLTELL